MTEVEPTQVEISPDGTQAWIHCKELSYADFGRSETLQCFRLAKMMESGRTLAMKGGFLDAPYFVNKEYGMFSMGMHYRILPELWRVRRGTGFPYTIHTVVKEIGQRSVTLQSRLINKLDQKELATVMIKFVHVHRATGRSARFPDWLLSKYQSVVREAAPPFTLPKSVPHVPASAYRYDVTVAECDTDHNKHCNNGTYVRFCCDATHAAVKEGRLPRLEPDATDFPLMELRTVYLGQSWMGDKLQVLLWQHEDSRDTVCYVIIRKKKDEERVIFHGSMVFGQSSAFRSHL